MKTNCNLWIIIFMITTIMLLEIIPLKAQQNNIDSLFTVLKKLDKTSDTSKVNTLNALAREFINNDPDTAIYFANEALTLAIKLNYKMGVADAYLWKGKSLDNLGDYEEALKSSNDALQIYNHLLTSLKTAEQSKILKQKARAYNNLGLIYWKQSDYPLALKNHLAALDIRKEIEDNEGIAGSYNNIGLIYLNQGDYPKALSNYFSALGIIKKTENKIFEVNITGNIGNIYYKQGNYPAALKSQFAALKIAEEIGYKPGIATAYYIIGNIYETQGNYQEALKNHFAALRIEEEIENKDVIASIYVNIGGVYGSQKNYPEALKNLLLSLKIFEEIGSNKGSAASHKDIGTIYRYQNNYPEALKHYFAAIKIEEEIGDKTDIAGSFIDIGIIYTKQNKYHEAFEYINKGLSVAKDIGSLDDIKESYRGLASLDSAQGNFKLALGHYKLFIANRDSIFNEENTKKMVQSQMQYDFDKKEAATKAQQDKKDLLSVAEIKRQTLINNGTLAGVGIAGFFSLLLVRSTNRRKKAAFDKTVSVVEMKALRSQMNPHFISNSMQSINKYIMDNEKESASEYLSRFTSLMRMILENSRKQEVTIEQDVHALELYLQLEALRYNNRFEYKIEISNDVSPENTLIPPLMLQPFVENSILHGIRTKEKGMIQIKVNREGDIIRCTVEDNGIGRTQSVVIESGEEQKRESLGMKITNERLAIINQLKKVKASINVFDLKSNDDMPQGVRVELVLPYEQAF